MISSLKKSIFPKFLWGFMACYMLNMSIDLTKPNIQYSAVNVSFNEQESIIELVLEKGLGFDNIIQELDDKETEEHHKKNNSKIDLIVHPTFDSFILKCILGSLKKKFPLFLVPLIKGFNQLDTPPPKI